MMIPTLYVPADLSPERRHAVAALAERFQLPLQPHPPAQGLYLTDHGDGLALAQAGHKGVVRVDFVSGALDYRRQKGGGELIGKAVNHTQSRQVWDATAGLGRDGFVLAGLGLQVTLFERHPAVAALLQDGLDRAALAPASAEIAARMHLIFGELATHTTPGDRLPEIVYLDPMYPERQKSAAVKKEMAYFHQLVGAQTGEAELLAHALRTARKRVVVKRPRLGDFLADQKPAYQYLGKSTRFDVYLPNTH